ncbi:putative diguanylate cyclase DgcE [compost metagenome]
MAYIGLDGTWLRVNDSLCELLGYSAEELYGMTFLNLTHPDDIDENMQYLMRLLAGEIERYVVEKRFRRKDGSHVWVHAKTTLQRRQDGRPDHLISVFEDISASRAERERLEARVAELEARLAANVS